MKQIVLKFGLIAGLILAAMLAVSVPLHRSGVIDFDSGEIIGYTSMVLAFLLIFFGIRSYRDNLEDGSITFGKGFQIGILITLVAAVIYVATWEIIYYGFATDFMDQYAAHVVANMRADGSTEAAIAEKTEELAKFAKLYENPLFNAAITFMEVFPVGLIVTLVSAAILRKRPSASTTASAAENLGLRT